jgi:hypothetical protein
MKMLLIAYDTFIDKEVPDCLETCGVPGYTKLAVIVGRGETGTKEDTPAWPGTTSVLFTGASDEQAETLRKRLACLRGTHGGRAGLKVFQIPVESSA